MQTSATIFPIMPALKRLLLALLLGAVSLLVNGCTSSDEETSIPWSRPQSWEGQVPGMGSSPGSGTR